VLVAPDDLASAGQSEGEVARVDSLQRTPDHGTDPARAGVHLANAGNAVDGHVEHEGIARAHGLDAEPGAGSAPDLVAGVRVERREGIGAGNDDEIAGRDHPGAEAQLVTTGLVRDLPARLARLG